GPPLPPAILPACLPAPSKRLTAYLIQHLTPACLVPCRGISGESAPSEWRLAWKTGPTRILRRRRAELRDGDERLSRARNLERNTEGASPQNVESVRGGSDFLLGAGALR